MGTLSGLLYLAQNSLDANQAALDITANNVANANTPGYTAKVATWQERDTVSINGHMVSSEGASVTATSQRDPVLNQRVQQQTQAVASSTAESTALDDLQSIFGLSTTSDNSASTTLGTDLNSFFGSFNALEASPSDISVRQGVLSAAQTLATDFNSSASAIAQQTSTLNQQASGLIPQVNSLLSTIAQLNLQIESTSPDADAGTLEDQRQQALNQLSQFIGFDQIRTENNGLTLSTANGQPLVSQGQTYPLSTSLVGGDVHVIASSGQDITTTIQGGELGGILTARDQDLPQAAAALDSLAYAIGSAVNTQNQAGLDANGNPGAALFNLTASAPGAAAGISLATTDPNAIAAAGAGQGSSGGANAGALAALSNSALLSGQTANGYYASFLTQLGSNVAEVQQENTTQQASLTQLTTQQSATSSVSLDREAANLMLYQRSYSAAARVFTIVDQMMSVALNLGIEAAVS
ncbi:MAG TPA: flagellar hook-associated protein FlgK [Acidobacteriaceae bacterium]|nr:flagellar hook-associated protein FlgK [Acidobacteriaceae bacterium]